MLRGQRRLEARRGGFETPAHQPGRRSGALKQLVATGCFWPTAGIGGRQLRGRSARLGSRTLRDRADAEVGVAMLVGFPGSCPWWIPAVGHLLSFVVLGPTTGTD